MTVDAPGVNNSGSGARGVISDSRYGADFFNHLISLQNDLQAGDATAVASKDQPALTNDENNIIYQAATNGAVQSRLDAEASLATARKTSLQQSISNVAGVYAQNEKVLAKWERSITEGHLAVHKGHRLSEDDELRRWVIHHLMGHFELRWDDLQQRFGVDGPLLFADAVAQLREEVPEGMVNYCSYYLRGKM